jgi:hypothetical protein
MWTKSHFSNVLHFFTQLGRRLQVREKSNQKKSLQAKHCEFNGIKFDSMSERDFYIRLCKIFGTTSVSRGSRVTLFNSLNLNVPDISWTPDFIVWIDNRHVFVEFKGSLSSHSLGTEVFLNKWKLIKGTDLSYRIKVVCFVAGSKCPRWNASQRRVSIPGIYPIANYSDDEIYDIVRSA